MAKVTWDKKPAIAKHTTAPTIGRPRNGNDKLTREVIETLEDIIGINKSDDDVLNALFWSDSDIVDELNDRIEKKGSKITKRTWRNWKAKCEAEDQNWLKKTEEHRELVPLIKRLKRLQKQYLGKGVLTNKNWTAFAWTLERKFPSEFGKTNELNVKGSVKNEHIITEINIHTIPLEPSPEEQNRLKKEYDIIDIPTDKK